MDARFFGRLIEFHHAIHHAVVRDGAGRHAQRLEPFHQRIDGSRAVEQAILRVQVQMGKHAFPRFLLFQVPTAVLQS